MLSTQLHKKALCAIALVCICFAATAQNRYWVSDVTANWNSDNWANSSNGAPDGGGPPTAAQNAIFDANGNGVCSLNLALDTVTNFSMTSYSGTIEFDGNSLRATGTVTLTGGTIDDNSGGSILTVASSATTTFNGTEIGVRLDITSTGIELDGSRFTEYCDFEKTGANNSYGSGGNTFLDTVLMVHSGTGGYFLTGGGNPDTFQNYLAASASGTGLVYLSYSGTEHYFNDSVIVSSTGTSNGVRFGSAGGSSTMSAGHSVGIGSAGFSSGELELRGLSTLGAGATTLNTTGTASIIDIYDCSFAGDVTTSSPRLYSRGTSFGGVTSLTKTGATNDASAGGNHFQGNTTILNSGTGYLLFGNGTPDSFDLNLDWTNTGTYNSYLAYNSADNYVGGNLTITNSSAGGTNSYFYVSQTTGSSLQIDGDVILTNDGSSSNPRIIFGDGGDVDVNGDLDAINSASGASGYIYIANGTASAVNIGGVCDIQNSGATTTKVVYLGNNGDISVADSLIIANSSTATSCLVYCNYTTNSSATYGGNIVVSSTDASTDGVYFGVNGGSATLAATRTISIGSGGFVGGLLYLRNFTQTGATNQTLSLGGSTFLNIYDCSFGGNVDFTAPNINTRGTTYGGTLDMRKTGSNSDNQAGGNNIGGAATLTNVGSGYWLWGNGNPDSFANNVIINDSSTSNFYLAYNSAGNYIDGDLDYNKDNAGATRYTYVSDLAGSSLEITGDVTIDMNSSGTTARMYFCDDGSLTVGGNLTFNNNSTGASSYAYVGTNTSSSATIGGDVDFNMGDGGTNSGNVLGNNGDVTVTGRVDIDNNSTGTATYAYVANGANSTVSIGGVTRVENDGSGTTRRTYLGNAGDVTFGDSLIILNSSDATNSQVYCNHASTSVNAYSGDILVESTESTNDGILFGNGTGSGTLAAGQTISITSNGFSGYYLYFRNFTQVGATAQSLLTTGTGYIYNYNSNWGGNVDFESPRVYIYSTTFSGTADIEKTGAGNDQGYGLNVFEGNTNLVNSGSNYFLMGNGNPDSFLLDLTMTNTGTNNMYVAYSSTGHYIGGDLSLSQASSGTGSTIYISNNSGTTLQIDGDASLSNTSTATSNAVYFGNAGSITLAGDLDLTNASSATTAQMYVGNAFTSQISIGGHAQIINSGTATSYCRTFFGNWGDISLSDSLIIENSSTSTNSFVYCNYEDSSVCTYAADIVLESSVAGCDGVSFGQAGGAATLAAGQTVSIGSGGFVSGILYFYNFDQIGPTAQTLTATGTTDMFITTSDWGGNVDFEAPRMRSQFTRYSGTASLEKTGATNDANAGGNYFASDATLTNSGSAYMMFGNGNPDTVIGDLTIANTGTNTFYYGQNSAGNYVGGDVSVTHTGSGTSSSMVFGNSAGSSIAIVGNVDLTSTPTATSSNFYFGNYTDITVGGDMDVTHAANSNTNQFLLAYQNGSDITISGVTELNLSGSGTSSLAYLGYQGDLIFQDSVYILNSSSATTSDVRVAYEDSSDVVFNGDIVVESSNASCDGVSFGQAGGNSTLADGQRIVIGPNGHIAGALYFYRFNQVGNTSQSLTTTGTSYIYNFRSDWDANVSLTGPRNRSDYSDFDGTLYFEKTGGTDEQGAGGNVVGGNATLVNSGSGYMMWGNVAADTFSSDLTLTNSGTRGIYVANNQPNHYVGGDISGSNTGSGSSSWIYVANGATSSITVDGDVNLSNTGTGTTTQIGFGLSGDATVAGSLTMGNNGTSTNSYGYVANGATSAVSIGGATRIENSGAGTTHRSYLGNSGDATLGDSLYLLNSSSAGNSQIYVGYNASSVNTIAGDIVLQNSNASGDGIYFGANTGTNTLAAGQTVTVNGSGFVAGTLYFRNFTQVGGTAQNITLTGAATMNNYNSNWGGNVTFTSPRFYTYSTDYDGTAYFEKTGSGNDASAGLNRITGNAELVNNGSGYFMMGNGNADSLLANATFTNSGTNSMYFANSTVGNYIGGDMSVTQSTTGTSTYFYFANGNASAVVVDGDASFTNTSSASNPRFYIGNGGDVDFNGRLDYSNTASGTNSYAYVGTGSTSTVTIDGVADFRQFNTGATTHALYIGNSGDVTFNDSLYVRNNCSSSNSTIYLNNGSTSANTYNGHIVLESYNATSDGIYFGNSTGTGTLTAGNTISIGANGWTSGQLYLRNFDQQGATAQSISLGGTSSIFSIYGSDFDGDLNFDAPRTFTNYSTFDGDFDFEKTGATNDVSTGGNTYNGDVTFRNSGTGYQMIPNNVADDYNGDVSFIKTSTGLMYPSYNSNSTYAGDMNFDANTAITLGASGGVVEFDGAGPQAINDLGTSSMPNFRRLEINNSGDSVTLNMTIEVQTTVTFTDGILNTDTNNILEIRDNGTVTGASDASFVYGYVEKVGNEAFEFPVGDSIYRPISISAPSGGSSRFRATYDYSNPAPTYTYGANDAPIDHVSTREFWILDRTNGTSSVNVTLSWDVNSGGVTDLSELLVARWDGDSWTSHGNGGTTGNTTTGTIVTSAAVGSFSPFTLASSTTNNPLPIELLAFDAKVVETNVEVNWTTATEIDNDYFTVERSANGVDFQALDFVNGAGNSTTVIHYSYIDENPLPGVSYYRLIQTDIDGTSTTSATKSVTFGPTSFVNIIPSGDEVQVIVELPEAKQLTLTLRNSLGQVVQQYNWEAHRKDNFVIRPKPIDATGVYFVTLSGNGIQETRRVFLGR